MICTIEVQSAKDRCRFVFHGKRFQLGKVLDILTLPGTPLVVSSEREPNAVTLCVLNQEQDEYPPGTWLGINLNDDPKLGDRAYEHGALTVLNGKVDRQVLLSALRNAGRAQGFDPQQLGPRKPVRSQKGTPIRLEKDEVLFIEQGIVRCASIHEDGQETLIGFFGQGELLLGHHEGSCHFEMIAHTPTLSRVTSWQEAVRDSEFHQKLKQRLCWMEAWAAAQVRGTLEDRLLAILDLLAVKFSRPHAQGRLLTLKMTHEQIAGVLGASRTTVTRLLGNLRREGQLCSVRDQGKEFYLLKGESLPLAHSS